MNLKQITLEEYTHLIDTDQVYVDNPFFLPGPFSVWLKHYGATEGFQGIYVIENQREKKKVVLLSNRAISSVPLIRRITIMGTICGAEIVRWSPYRDGYTNDEYAAIIDFVLSKMKRSVCKLVYLPCASLDSIRTCLSRRLVRTVWMSSTYSSVVKKEFSFDEYVKKCCKRLDMKEVRRVTRRLKEQGELELKVFDTRKGDNVLQAIKDVMRVSQKSWKVAANTGIASKGTCGKYYNEIIETFDDQKITTFFILKHRGIAIASLINVIFNGTCYCFKAEYDNTYRKYYPGSVLMHQALERMFADDMISRIDFLADYNYMKTWTRETEEYASLAVFSSSLKGRLYAAAMRTVRAVKETLRKK